MGTNFFLLFNGTKIHIGKKSGGWKFTWHGYRAQDGYSLTSVTDYVTLIGNRKRPIVDEYGRTFSLVEFLSWIEADSRDKSGHAEFPYPNENNLYDEHGNEFCYSDFS